MVSDRGGANIQSFFNLSGGKMTIVCERFGNAVIQSLIAGYLRDTFSPISP
jgi:hypothetical protein